MLQENLYLFRVHAAQFRPKELQYSQSGTNAEALAQDEEGVPHLHHNVQRKAFHVERERPAGVCLSVS